MTRLKFTTAIALLFLYTGGPAFAQAFETLLRAIWSKQGT